MRNLVLAEADFEEFKSYCRRLGFDLSYFSTEMTGFGKEIENHRFDTPKVIKLKKKPFGYQGTSYDVAEWQQAEWQRRFADIVEGFTKMRMETSETETHARSSS